MLFKTSFKKNLHRLDKIAENIKKLNQKGANNLHVNIYINDQILFQIMPSKNFADDGLNYDFGDFSILHFFNDNKHLTHKTWKKFEDEKLKEKFFYFEKPKGVHNYIEHIKRNDKSFQQKINKAIELYHEDTIDKKIEIEYVDY